MIPAFCIYVIMPILALSLLLTLVRLVRGPHVADRVIALDLLTMVGMGMIVTHAIGTGEEVTLDMAVVLAMIGFLSTVGFARYLERGSR